jgi:hypothetical protein
MIDDQEVIYHYLFAFNFSSNLIVLLHVLAFAKERKIVLASDACSRPPIITRSHDLHASDIRGAVGEIAPYDERYCLSPFLSPLGWLWPSFFYWWFLVADIASTSIHSHTQVGHPKNQLIIITNQDF